MTTEAISRREFLEHLGILGGLGALYSGMTGFGLPATAQAIADDQNLSIVPVRGSILSFSAPALPVYVRRIC